MGKMPWIKLALVGLCMAAISGCEVSTGSDFDPRGVDVALRTAGAWQINGVDANQARCDAAGIAAVRLVFVDGGDEYTYDDFTFPCEIGSYMSDTRVLARGVYTVKWEALNADGDVTHATTTPQTLDADRDSDIAVIDTPNFSGLPQTDATLKVALSWDLDESDEFDGVSCEDLGEIQSISYTLTDTTMDPEMVVAGDADVACENLLTFTAPDVLPGETYRLDVSGGPDSESVYWEAHCAGLQPSDGAATLDCHVLDVRPRLHVIVKWDSTVEAGFEAGTCADLPIPNTVMTYSLVDTSNDDVVASESGVACSDDLYFAAPDVELGKTYRLDIDGGVDANSQDWTVSCTELSAAAGAAAEFNCLVGYQTPE